MRPVDDKDLALNNAEDCMNPTITDTDIIDAMITNGGSFVQALGHAARRADQNNLARIKTAFADYWESYAKVAESLKARKS